MAPTYELIASNTLTTDTASVTFSAIPATYTDLLVKCSVRLSDNGISVASFYVYANGVTTGGLYSNTRIQAEGSSVSSGRVSNSNVGLAVTTTQDGATSNTFGSAEIYLPNYTVSSNKAFSVNNVAENNSSTVNLVGARAVLWRSTNTISSLQFSADSTFMTGSSFFLYGIKNS
jgi:hypothetical protein